MTIKSVREVNGKSMHEASYLTHKLVQWSYITQALLKYKQPLRGIPRKRCSEDKQ